MMQVQTDLSRGVFDPLVAKDLTEAFEKAERYLDRLCFGALIEIDRDRVARRIVSEARAGETQPDLVWRAAVAKVLLERQAVASEADSEPATKSVDRQSRRRATKPAVPADMPTAGPHATPQLTNDEATPGAGALPAELPGDDVDPGAG
jgi:hypothetical protein